MGHSAEQPAQRSRPRFPEQGAAAGGAAKEGEVGDREGHRGAFRRGAYSRACTVASGVFSSGAPLAPPLERPRPRPGGRGAGGSGCVRARSTAVPRAPSIETVPASRRSSTTVRRGPEPRRDCGRRARGAARSSPSSSGADDPSVEPRGRAMSPCAHLHVGCPAPVRRRAAVARAISVSSARLVIEDMVELFIRPETPGLEHGRARGG